MAPEPSSTQPWDPGERLWGTEETARYLGVPTGTLYRWRVTGGGPPAYRVGRHLRYDPAEVRAWVRTRSGAR